MRRDWPILLSAAVLMFAGSARAVVSEGLDPLAVALLAAGLICLGYWLHDEG